MKVSVASKFPKTLEMLSKNWLDSVIPQVFQDIIDVILLAISPPYLKKILASFLSKACSFISLVSVYLTFSHYWFFKNQKQVARGFPLEKML